MVKSSTVVTLLCCGFTLLILWREDISALLKLSAPPLEVHGHRGAYGTLPPGNTMASIQEGVRQGADVIECDLRLTKDEQVVAGHDRTVAKECTGRSEPERAFAQLTLPQVRQYDCHANLAGVQSPPTLEEILQYAIEQGIGLNLELKPKGNAIARSVFESLRRQNDACDGCLEEKITVQSFEGDHLKTLRRLANEKDFHPRLSFLTTGISIEELLTMKDYVDVYSPEAKSLDRILIGKIALAEMKIIPWTVNDPYEMCQLARWGVDGLITDFPERAVPLARQVDRTGERPENCNAYRDIPPISSAP